MNILKFLPIPTVVLIWVLLFIVSCKDKTKPHTSGVMVLKDVEVKVVDIERYKKRTHITLQTTVNGIPIKFYNLGGYKDYTLTFGDHIIIPQMEVRFEIYDNEMNYYPQNVNLDKYVCENCSR